MNITKYCILLVCWALPYHISQAADFFDLGEDSFVRLSNQPLLQSASISSFVQDSRGFIWFGTETGLYRFDGYRVKIYRHDPDLSGSIPENFVYALWPLKNGKLWVSTSATLSLFDPATESFKQYRHDPGDPYSLINTRINQIQGAIDGGIWIATFQGLDYLAPNSKKFIHHQHDPESTSSLASNSVYTLYRDTRGTLLIGTSNGISQLNVNRAGFTHLYSDRSNPYSLYQQSVRSMLRDNEGKLWMGTQTRGIAWVNKSGEIQRYHPSHQAHKALRFGQITAISQPNDEEIWVASYASGIFVLDVTDGRFLRKISHDTRLDTTLVSNNVSGLDMDNSGLLWITQQADKGGVSFINTQNANSRMLYYKPQGKHHLSVDRIRSISQASADNLWIAGIGLNLFSPEFGRLNFDVNLNYPSKTWFEKIDSASRQGRPIIGFSEFEDGSLWAVQNPLKLSSYKPSTGSSSTLNTDALSCSETSQFVAAESRFIIFNCAGQARIFNYDTLTDTLISFEIDPDQSHSFTRSNQLLLDTNYRLWIATEQGLYYVPDIRDKKGTITKVSEFTTNVSSLMLDARQQLWVDSERGLYKASATGFNRLDNINKLPRTDVFGGNMQQSQDGRIWGNKGVLDVANAHFYAIPASLNSDLSRSWKNVSLLVNPELLMFAGPNGLLMVKPAGFNSWYYDPPLVITNLMLDKQTQVTTGISSLTLSPSDQSFSIDIASLDFSAPMLNQYRYKLIGRDLQWIYTNKANRRLSFNDLSPQNYELIIDGSNSQGEFGSKQLRIPITVMPSWYQSTWFRLIMLVGLLAGLYLVYTLRLRQLTLKKNKLSCLIRDQGIELSRRNRRLQTTRTALAQKQQELKRKTKELDNQNAELRLKTEVLSDSLEEIVLGQEQLIAKEKIASLGELVAGLAHEVNTPLGISVTASSHLHDRIETVQSNFENGTMTQSGLEKFLNNTQLSTDIMLTNLLRAAELIQSFKNMSVEDRDELETEFNLADCLNKIARSLSPKLKHDGHKFDVFCNDEWRLRGKPGIISQIIVNLVMNSCTHAFPSCQQGQLKLVVEKYQDIYTLHYSDDGCGISDDIIDKIFDPFFTTNKKGGGSGLGLNIVYNLITQKLMGEISCDSTIDQGTRFKLVVPA